MPIGTIKTYHADRGFGFIAPDDGSKQIFFHVTQLNDGASDDPVLGARVGYEVGKSRTASAKDDPAKSVMAVRLRYV